MRALKFGVSTGALALAMAVAGAAAAQTAPAAQDDAVEEIVVTGFRASLANAIDVKRRSNDIVDVIKAEDIADFPDLNLAESLQRIPGVAIDRDSGEGRTITVRGLSAEFTRVRLNGLEALATTGGKDGSGGANRGRSFDFNVFASELFSSLTVRKSSSAETEEGSLGATIDLQTGRPFDYNKFVLSMGAQVGYNDLSESKDPRYTFLISNTWKDGRIGALLSVAYSARNTLEEGSSTGRWENPSVSTNSSTAFPCFGAAYNPSSAGAATGGSTALNSAACSTIGTVAGGTTVTSPAAAGTANNLWHPRIPRYGRLAYDQARLGVTGSLQWKPTDNSTLTFDALLAKLKNDRDETYLEVISFSRAGQGLPQTDVVNFTKDADGHLIKGTFDDVDARVEYRHDELNTEFSQFGLTYDILLWDKLKVTAMMGQSKSIQRNPVQTTFSFERYNTDGYSYDYSIDDKLPAFNYGFDVTNPASYVYSNSSAQGDPSLLRLRPSKAVNTFKTERLDLAYEVDDHLTIRAGGALKEYGFNSWEARNYSRVIPGGSGFVSEAGFPLPAGVTIADVSQLITGFGRNLDLPAGTPTAWIAPDLGKLQKVFGYDCNCINAYGDFRLSTLNQLGQLREITEKDLAWYLQADFDGAILSVPVRGNFGVRYSKTELSSLGHYNVGSVTTPVSTPVGLLSTQVPTDGFVTASRDYHDVLPSMNITAQPLENLYIRFAAAKVMSRPQLPVLTPGFTAMSQSAQTLTRGNPDLEPVRANTMDLNFEWYADKETLFSLGLFQKKITSYIQSQQATVLWSDTGLPNTLLTNGNTPSTVFYVTQALNTPGGTLKGYEISLQKPFTFLPEPFDGFGGIVNFTHVTSDITYVVTPANLKTGVAAVTVVQPLVNLSPNSYNVTLYYEKAGLKARISGAYRDEYLLTVPGGNGNDVRGKFETFNLDAQVSYDINEHLKVSLEMINLTDEFDSKWDDSKRQISEEYVHFGRQFYLGASYKF